MSHEHKSTKYIIQINCKIHKSGKIAKEQVFHIWDIIVPYMWQSVKINQIA